MVFWSSRVKILIVNKFLHPNGGSETYIFEIGKQLIEMGHEVQFFGMEHEKRIVGNHAESYTTNMDFHTGGIGKILYPFKIIYSLEAKNKIDIVLNDFEPDVIHLNNFNFQLTPSIIYEIRKYKTHSHKKVRLFYTAHDYQLVCPNHMMRIPYSGENCERCLTGQFSECVKHKCIHNSRIKSLLGSIEGGLYSRLKTYQNFDCIICPSFFLEEKLRKISVFKGKTITLHNFVDSSNNAGNIKKKYILYFGRFSDEKGISTLLKVCRRLPDIPFIFAGKGPLEEEINLVENVRNVGFQKGLTLKKLISEASFSIYPSEWYENCPFSVMESIVNGTPVVGANIGGIPELIVNQEDGLLFESGNAEDLYEKILYLWNNENELNKYTVNCRKKKFDSLEEYCSELLKIYDI